MRFNTSFTKEQELKLECLEMASQTCKQEILMERADQIVLNRTLPLAKEMYEWLTTTNGSETEDIQRSDD